MNRRLLSVLILMPALAGCSGCGEKPAPPPPPAAQSAPPPETAPVHPPAGGADTFLDSFDGAAGSTPSGWKTGKGHWTLALDESAARGPSVLKQDAAVEDWAVLLKDGVYAGNLAVEVRFKPLSGKEDASGGIVLRAQDKDNYYLCRANALEGNFRLYYIKDNDRIQIETASVEPPALGTWHTLQMSVQGDTIHCGLDGRELLSHRMDPAKEPAWPSGRVGLWTKADSVTEFDDVAITRMQEAP